MPFEKFVPPRKPKPPQVSLKRTGTITFDNAFAATFGLVKASHAIIYYDPARKLIGVKPARDPKDEGAMRISHRKRVCSLRARSFFEVYGIKLERTAHYPVALDREGAMALVELGGVKRRRGPRKRRA